MNLEYIFFIETAFLATRKFISVFKTAVIPLNIFQPFVCTDSVRFKIHYWVFLGLLIFLAWGS